MAKKYDLAVKTGEYESDGETKGRYENIGVIMEGEKGFYMLLRRTFNPAGVKGQDDRESIMVSMFEPKKKGEAKADKEDDDSGSIPF